MKSTMTNLSTNFNPFLDSENGTTLLRENHLKIEHLERIVKGLEVERNNYKDLVKILLKLLN